MKLIAPRRRRALTALAFFIVTAVALRAAWATSVIALDADALIDRADRIVHGTCTDCHTYRDSDDLIVTRYTFEVHETLKGDESLFLQFVQPGGEYRGMTLVIPGLSVHEDGDEAILFLGKAHGKKGDRRFPIGLDQGVYRVVTTEAGDPQVRRDMTGLHVVDRAGSSADLPQGGTPEQFKRAVRQRLEADE